MPRLVLLQDGQVKPLAEEAFLDEGALQRLLEEHPELVALDDVDPTASPLVPIGREVPLSGQSLDLLFLESSGRLTAVETKLWRNPDIRRAVVGQVLEYGAHLSTWTVDDVEQQAARYLADPQTPVRFRGQSLYAALASSGSPTNGAEAAEEGEFRARIAERLAANDMRLIIAVDRIVDSLRGIVGFVSDASQFRMFLLEIQEHRATDGTRIASISVYGPAKSTLTTVPSHRGTWDETRFLERLQSDSRPESAGVVRDLYAFAQEEAHSVIWGTGMNVGSAAFGVRRGGDRFAVFGVTTKGEVYASMENLLRRDVAEEARSSLLATLRSAGVDARDDRWFTFEASLLSKPADLQRFKDAVLGIRDSLA